MRWPSKEETLKAVAPSLIAIGLAIPGLQRAEPWERVVFTTAILISIAYTNFELWTAIRYMESRTIRRRCHKLINHVGKTLFGEDTSLEITIFLPNRMKGDPYLVPVVRYRQQRPLGYKLSSKARFRTDSSSIICQAWQKPGELARIEIPSHTFKTKDMATGWFLTNLLMEEAEVKRLSKRTLREVKCIANAAFTGPYEGNQPIGLISFTSTRNDAFRLTKEGDEALGEYLESLAVMLHPT